MGKRDPNVDAKWREKIGMWERSGQTIKAFCQEQGATESSFHYWRRVLRRRDGQDARLDRRAERSKGAAKRFIQLQLAPLSSSLRIHLADGLAIDVPATLDRQTLAEIIAAARMAASC
jgi:hypothetical protein